MRKLAGGVSVCVRACVRACVRDQEKGYPNRPKTSPPWSPQYLCRAVKEGKLRLMQLSDKPPAPKRMCYSCTATFMDAPT